jgi:carbon-monoxide dehydrogenase medium subunit
MVAESVRGRRTIVANDFFRGIFETALEPDELLIAVEIPIPGPSWRSYFMEFARRQGDFAIAGLAMQARLDSTRLSDIRMVLFGIDDRAIRVRSAEQALLGSASGAEGIAAAQTAMSDELSPMFDSHASAELRLHYARVLIERTVRQLGVT